MNKRRLTHAKATATVSEVIESILDSPEWEQSAAKLSTMDYMDAREPFRRFFDTYEGSDCEEWLGIMEWAVIEQLRTPAPDFVMKHAIIDAIVYRMELHPNVSLER